MAVLDVSPVLPLVIPFSRNFGPIAHWMRRVNFTDDAWSPSAYRPPSAGIVALGVVECYHPRAVREGRFCRDGRPVVGLPKSNGIRHASVQSS